MFTSAILLTALLAPGAGPKTPFAMGCLDMDPEQTSFLRAKGIDVVQFAKGMKDVPPPSYQIKWAPRPHPVGQGSRGTCVSWALSYAAKSCLEARESEQYPDSPDSFFSPSFIYSQRQNRGTDGMNLGNAIYIMYQHGCVPYRQMPYLEASADEPPTVQALAQAYTYQIADWMVIEPPGTDKIKLALAHDLPVVITANVTKEFQQIQGDAVFNNYDPKNNEGGHAMCVIGYDDQRRAFRLINSWGLDWADHGYCWVSYDLFESTEAVDKRFFKLGAALFDAPNLTTKVVTADEGQGRYSWSASILGSPKALGEVESVSYVLPAGYEPGVVERKDPNGDGSGFTLRSSDLNPPFSISPVEVWAQFSLKSTKRKMAPRPIYVACGTPRTSGREPGRPAVPPSWIAVGSTPTSAPERRPGTNTPTGSEATVAVPDVTGLDSGMAILRLMSLGLEPKVHHDPALRSGLRAGAVMQQSPRPGVSVTKGSKVLLTVP